MLLPLSLPSSPSLLHGDLHSQDHPERLDLLLSLASTNPELPFAPLVK